jgi:hypothetical protein
MAMSCLELYIDCLGGLFIGHDSMGEGYIKGRSYRRG